MSVVSGGVVVRDICISVCAADFVERDGELRFIDVECRVDVVAEIVRVETFFAIACSYLL